MSRTGKREEILKGPLIYGIVFVLVTIVYWKTSPIGIIALMILCGGDGIADIIGKKIPSRKIPWSREKSLAGSIAMLLGGIIMSVLVLSIFSLSGEQYAGWIKLFPKIILISFICAFVESLPIHDFDNLTVPAMAIILGHLLLNI
jgi:phytol kinase